MNSIKVCEYSRSRSFHDDLILQDQASGERSQDQWSSGWHKRHKIEINRTEPKIKENVSVNAYHSSQISHFMRKPDFCLWENEGLDKLHSRSAPKFSLLG